MAEILGSNWGAEKSGLNQHLVAKIYPVTDKGEYLSGENTVAAPLTEGNLDVSLNWSSPFENTGTDSKLPAISQLLQSGQAETMLNLMASLLPQTDSQSTLQTLAAQAGQGANMTGITKLNSRQVFTGMPPLKIPITMYFRAWSNPVTEVEDPVNQLFAWALPQFLAADSVLVGGLNDLKNGQVNLDTLFPSRIPRFVALEYGGRTYKPLVIESLGTPLVMPRDKNGAMLNLSIQLTLATLDAWDKGDWARSAGVNSSIGLDQFLKDSGF